MCKNSGVTDVFTDGSGKVLGKRNTDCGSRITDNIISVCQTAEMDKPRGMFLYGGKATGKMPAGNYAVYNLTVSGNTLTTTGGGSPAPICKTARLQTTALPIPVRRRRPLWEFSFTAAVVI